MATTEERLVALAQTIGADVKALRDADGNLTTLSTAAKTNLVSAINEVLGIAQSAAGSASAVINDASASATTTYSSNKVLALLTSLKDEILGGASAAYDTLIEIQHALENDATSLTDLLTAVGNRVRFDAAQTLTVAQQLTACTNIGIGNPAVDLVAVYTTARS